MRLDTTACCKRRVLTRERGLMASRRLLLVEDSSTMRRMLSTMLKEDGLRGRDSQRRPAGTGEGTPGTAARADPDRLRDARARWRRALSGAQGRQGAAVDPGPDADDLGRGPEQDRRADGRCRRLYREAEGPGRLPRAVRADSTLICGSPTSIVSWPSATACWKRPTRS